MQIFYLLGKNIKTKNILNFLFLLIFKKKTSFPLDFLSYSKYTAYTIMN